MCNAKGLLCLLPFEETVARHRGPPGHGSELVSSTLKVYYGSSASRLNATWRVFGAENRLGTAQELGFFPLLRPPNSPQGPVRAGCLETDSGVSR